MRVAKCRDSAVKEYVVELSQVDSFADAIAAFNEGLIERCGGHWNGNLDAFNDYLSWPAEEGYRLVLRGADASEGVPPPETRGSRAPSFDDTPRYLIELRSRYHRSRCDSAIAVTLRSMRSWTPRSENLLQFGVVCVSGVAARLLATVAIRTALSTLRDTLSVASWRTSTTTNGPTNWRRRAAKPCGKRWRRSGTTESSALTFSRTVDGFKSYIVRPPTSGTVLIVSKRLPTVVTAVSIDGLRTASQGFMDWFDQRAAELA
jgi:hypothetical protein